MRRHSKTACIVNRAFRVAGGVLLGLVVGLCLLMCVLTIIELWHASTWANWLWVARALGIVILITIPLAGLFRLWVWSVENC